MWCRRCARPSSRSNCAPGAPIDKNAICERLGVSRFPVSEALARLQAEGLVDILPQRGTSVSRIRMSEVAEFMFVRKALESEAVRALVLAGPGPVLVQLRAALSSTARGGKAG